MDCFYKHSQMKDGHLNKCIDCSKKDVIKNRNKKIEYYREYDRERGSKPDRVLKRKEYQERMKTEGKWPEMRKRYTNNYRKKNLHKYFANHKVSNAKRAGRLEKEKCSICGNKKTEAHHPDYRKPLDVMWLCDKCHKQEHKKIREKQRREENE